MRTIIPACAALAALLSLTAVTPAPSRTVEIKSFAFSPKSLTITAGQSIRFVNEDQEAHTATAVGGAFNTGGLDTNESSVIAIAKPGTYQYFCSLHPYMKGVIVVRSAGGR